MRDTAHWASWFAADWKLEFPLQIHNAEVAPDGSPRWHPDFMRWITREEGRAPRNPEQRLRTTRAMRKLRQWAVREYEVLYRVLVLGEPLEETTRWLNERAAQNGIPFPEHRPDGPYYTHKDAWALLIAGIGYAKEHW